jgi:uncharacterized protein YjbJ (UPF0337 family)
MADKNTGPKAGVEGVVEDVKGSQRSDRGKLTGNEDLEREGGAQQDKADAEREVAKRRPKPKWLAAKLTLRGRAAGPSGGQEGGLDLDAVARSKGHVRIYCHGGSQ